MFLCRLCMCVKSQTAYERLPSVPITPAAVAIQRARHCERHVPRRERSTRSPRRIVYVRGPATLAVIVYSFEKLACPPPPGGGRRALVPGRGCYLTSTFAPTSSNFFLIVAASSLLTPSLTGLGAASTRSFASLRPRLVTSRTTLITLILFAPTSVSVTVNSVFSSAGAAAAAPPPPATTTGAAAAADTPSSCSRR